MPLSKSVNYRTIMFSYVSWDPDEYRLSRSSVSYVGEFDDQGRPHGLGEWTDHTFTGEALQGESHCAFPGLTNMTVYGARTHVLSS